MELIKHPPGPASSPWEPVMDRLETTAPRTLGRLARALIVKGVLALVFGIVLLAWPEPTVLAVVAVLGTFAIVDGLSAIWMAATSAAPGERWPSVLHGIVGVTVGAVVFVWPDITTEALLYVLGAWAIVKGLLEIAAAARLRASGAPRALLGLCGVVTAAFGVFVFVDPDAGAVAVRTVIAVLAMVTGASFMAAAVGLERWTEVRGRSAIGN